MTMYFFVYLPTQHADSIKTQLQYVTYIHNFHTDVQHVGWRHYIKGLFISRVVKRQSLTKADMQESGDISQIRVCSLLGRNLWKSKLVNWDTILQHT